MLGTVIYAADVYAAVTTIYRDGPASARRIDIEPIGSFEKLTTNGAVRLSLLRRRTFNTAAVTHWRNVTQAIATIEPSDTPEPELSSLRILAAEDNPTNRLVLKKLLGIVDVDVVIVEDGAQAVEAWENETWDLILMDIQMPVMDGVDAARAIRAREAELGRARTPIVALTANSMSHQIGPYFEAGMDAHLSKPIESVRCSRFSPKCWRRRRRLTRRMANR